MEIGAYVPARDDLREWLDLLEKGGINFVLSIPEEKKREKMLNSVIRVMEKGKVMGAEVIVVHPGGVVAKEEEVGEHGTCIFNLLTGALIGKSFIP